ncbi:MAG: hypothetical protein V3571_00030 [Pseudodesulfovibrio sp.]
MSTPPALTAAQKRRFTGLKKQLIEACQELDTKGGKVIARDLKNLLLPTGHQKKYYEMLLHLCDALIVKEECDTAESFLDAIITNSNSNTRLYQEANVLMAICKIHLLKLGEAEFCIKNAFGSKAIKSNDTRKRFLEIVTQRLEEEALLTSFRSSDAGLSSGQVLKKVEEYCTSNVSEDGLFEDAGKSVPNSAIDFMSNINEMAKRQLAYSEQLMLPPPPGNKEFIKIGKRVFGVISRKVWPFICSKNCKVQQTIKVLEAPECIISCMVAELSSQGIGTTIVAVVSTLVIRQSLKAYCTKWSPKGLMGYRYKRL